MEAATDLGAAGHEVPAIQHPDFSLFLYRKILRPFVRPFVRPSSLTVFEHHKGRKHVVEKEKRV